MNMESTMKFCQSCGMPLTDELFGTNADGTKSLPQPVTKEEYIARMKQFFPHLKRWRG